MGRATHRAPDLGDFGYDIIPNYRFTMLICTVGGSGDTTGSWCGSKNIME